MKLENGIRTLVVTAGLLLPFTLAACNAQGTEHI